MTETPQRKNIAYLYADLDRSALGLRSRIADELAGPAILTRTLDRLEQAQKLDETIIFCPSCQKKKIAALTQHHKSILIGLSQPAEISNYLKRRKWSLAGWRGGLGEATVFDEQPVSREIVQILRDRDVYTAVAVPPEAVMIDPVLIDAMLDHHHQHVDEMRFTFAHSAPGLTACVFRLDLLHEVAMTNSHMGDVLAYYPKQAHMDYINEICCFEVPQELTFSPFRYLADTQRSIDLIGRALTNGLSGRYFSAGEAVASIEPYLAESGPLPAELEIEITTEPSLRIEGYPHRHDQNRGPMTLDQFKKIVNGCTAYDDIRITIGGFGEPLAHPDLPAMIAAAKEAGIFGVNIETDGRRLNAGLAEQLLQSQADIISVHLDADSESVYRQVKGQDGFEEIIKNIETFIEKSKHMNGPIVVPHMVKMPGTLDEMERFYDRWLTANKAAVISGYNDFAGQIDDHAIMDMRPPKRYPCGRLWRWMTLLADGRAVVCSQDFKPVECLGNVFEQSVGKIWQGSPLNALRQSHMDGRFDHNPLCSTCKEWHR